MYGLTPHRLFGRAYIIHGANMLPSSMSVFHWLMCRWLYPHPWNFHHQLLKSMALRLQVAIHAAVFSTTG